MCTTFMPLACCAVGSHLPVFPPSWARLAELQTTARDANGVDKQRTQQPHVIRLDILLVWVLKTHDRLVFN